MSFADHFTVSGEIDPDLWQRIDAQIRAEGRDPEALLAQAAANIEAWREHGKTCNGTCLECKRAFEACVDWIVSAPEIAKVIP